MKIIVLSPETIDPRETAAMASFFAAGLERYHVRKPRLEARSLEAWLRDLPRAWRSCLVLHSHHELVHRLGLAGCHYREADLVSGLPALGRCRQASRSCHDLANLESSLGCWSYVLFAPVFSSLSKPGHGPSPGFSEEALGRILRTDTAARRATKVFALGGVSPERLARCRELGFDGAALLGGVWQAADPAAAYRGYLEQEVAHVA